MPFFYGRIQYFCTMKWIGQRVSFVDDKGWTTIVIYPEKKPIVTGLMGAWVAMWLVIGATVIWSLFSLQLAQQEKIILYIFLTFWGYYAVKVVRSFFWILWGKELIKIDETALHYKRSIKKYGRSAPYYLENIRKIELFQPEKRSLQSVWESSPWVQGGERIQFEHLNKVVRMARKLEEKDAKLLFSLVTKRIDDHLRRKK
jgi:hypothetical protein